MKINFYCYNCQEEFNVTDKFLLKKDSVICPNCSLKFNEKSFPLLKEAIQKISDCKTINESNNTRLTFKIIDND